MIKDGFAEGKDLVVSVMSAMVEEQICALKDIGPKQLSDIYYVKENEPAKIEKIVNTSVRRGHTSPAYFTASGAMVGGVLSTPAVNAPQTEVTYLSQLHHPNLVKLIGYCSEGHKRLLVYEYMPKGSLENHLF